MRKRSKTRSKKFKATIKGRMTFGVFKELYRGYGIYFADGSYNVEGNGEFKSVKAAKQEIDKLNVAQEARETAEKAAWKGLRAVRKGDGAVITAPNGDIYEFPTMRAARQAVFDLEDRYNVELKWVD